MATVTIEDLEARQTEIRTLIEEIDAEHAGESLPEESREEWNRLNAEFDSNAERLAELRARQDRVRTLAGNDDGREEGVSFQTARPGTARGNDIYDLSTVRASFTDPSEAASELRSRAMRALERAFIPHPTADASRAKGHVEKLIDKLDGDHGNMSRYLVATDSPAYKRAFPKLLQPSGLVSLSREEQAAVQQAQAAARALSLTTASGGYAVPFVLDPTIVPTSNLAVNPFRAIARVEQITVDEWRGVTSAGITATWDAEGAEASDDSPTLAQPTISTEKGVAFVPFSIEVGMDWGSLAQEMARLIQDGKDELEATAFATGSGSTQPFGVLTSATATVTSSTGGAFNSVDLYTLEAQLPPRFRPRASMVMNRFFAQKIRQFDTGGGAQLWIDNLRIGLDNQVPTPGNYGATLLGYGAYESSAMAAAVTTGSKAIIMGDFSHYLIADRIGLNLEYIPHLFHTGNNRPSGQRGIYAFWRVGAGTLSTNAFRTLQL